MPLNSKNKVRYYIYPYKPGSRSASALSAALQGRVLKHEGSKFVPGPGRYVINWGSSDCPYEALNTDNYVILAGNKLEFFKHASQSSNAPRLPLWTDRQDVAQAWLSGGRGSTKDPRFEAVVARQTLTGHSGKGIVITKQGDTLPSAPLYVEYVPKDAEYRIHVFNNEVIDVQRKIKDPSIEEPKNWAVRSHDNGFIFARNAGDGRKHSDICPGDVLEQAKTAMACSGLVFGGVDVLWNEKRKKAYVLEINTACGLEGETPNIYAGAIRRYYGEA